MHEGKEGTYKARHGDVEIIEIKELPKDLKKREEEKNKQVLAWGEVTGHAHRTDVGQLFQTKDGELYLKTDKLTTVTHEEHKNIELQPGNYRIQIKRQFDPKTDYRNVAD